MAQQLRDKIFQSGLPFEELALEVFRFQAEHSPVYKRFLELLKRDPREVRSISEIPFLPIELFKSHDILTKGKTAEAIFSSSGTGQSGQSRHNVADVKLYEESIQRGFEQFFGALDDYRFYALLPSYLEREGSSLIYMVRFFMEESNSGDQFFLYNHDDLLKAIKECPMDKTPFVIGVSFALLDLAESHRPDLSRAIIMETGGMKGRRRELTREELHEKLSSSFNCEYIYSEYGMTELLSQAYSKGEGIFECPPWMQIRIADVYDPFRELETGQSGLIQVVDLANLYSCSFIATSDMGRALRDGRFEVLGRLDFSDVRGCNLMVAQDI
jgi:phenylacetate-coenzyme A ligase PaaK-like adenylate-forming protein